MASIDAFNYSNVQDILKALGYIETNAVKLVFRELEKQVGLSYKEVSVTVGKKGVSWFIKDLKKKPEKYLKATGGEGEDPSVISSAVRREAILEKING